MKKQITTTLILMLWSSVGFAAETRYQLQVNGLVCPFCQFNVEKKLGKIDGVLKVKANLKAGTVSVLMIDGKTLPEDIVRQKITEAGFTLQSIEVDKTGNKQ